MDADGRFVVGSDEFIELMGPRTTAAFGRLWSEIAAELKLDPQNKSRARSPRTRLGAASRSVAGATKAASGCRSNYRGCRCSIATANFRGYRGFGVCRDIARINQLARARRERPIGFMPPPEQCR